MSELDQKFWQEWLEPTRHDLFHTAQYHRIGAEPTEATAYLAVYGDRDKFVALPYLLRPISMCGVTVNSALKEVSSIYGYTGPIAHNCHSDQEFQEEAWRAISAHWSDQGAVSAFIRFHPVLGNGSSFTGTARLPNGSGPDGTVALIGNTVAIDLLKTPDEIWYGYSRQIRQAVRRCSSEGIAVAEDVEWEHLDDFVTIYHNTMKRNNADNFYFFSTSYLRALKNAIRDHACLMVARDSDKVVSAAILTEYGGIVNLYLLATDSEYLHLSPSKALLHESQLWAKARGNRVFHLGGGRGGRVDDALFHFKAAFSNQYLPFYVGRWILDTSTYMLLTEQRRREADARECKIVDSSFFPAYRAPLLDAPIAQS